MQLEAALDPIETAKAVRRRQQFDQNSVWLQAHISEVYSQHRGECICIAGQELFAGHTADEAIKKARAAHPEDDGWFTRYIPKEKVSRIYAFQW